MRYSQSLLLTNFKEYSSLVLKILTKIPRKNEGRKPDNNLVWEGSCLCPETLTKMSFKNSISVQYKVVSLHLYTSQWYVSGISCSEVGKMTTFDLTPVPWGGGAWGAGTNIWHPETPASYTQIPTLWIHSSGRGAGRGALILDWCWVFDLFASVDAHLCSCSEGGR